MRVKTVEELSHLYGPASKRALQKQLSSLEVHSIKFLALSPFAVLASYDKNGEVDSSPRGGEPGFVKVVNNRQIAIPDARGNNRLDTLINIVETGRVACIFLIPGVDETLRINGRAHLSVDPAELELYADQKNPPKSIIKIDIEDVYLHCAKAIMRAKLWEASSLVERNVLPSMGKMIADQIGDTLPQETQQAMLARYAEQM